MGEALYDRYGGFTAVSGIVQDFYDRVLQSELLREYFKEVDMEGLIAHQTDFLCKVLGGPDNYSGRSLKAVHRGLNISAEAFEEVARCLEQSLDQAGVERVDIDAVLNIVASTREDIVQA